MANIAFARPNWVAGSNFATPAIGAGFGSFESTMPASNLLTEFLAEKARTTDVTTASTKVRIDLGVARGAQAVGIIGTNVSTPGGQVKISAYSDAAYSEVVEAGAFADFWADVYPWGTLFWGAPGLMTSQKLTPEQADGYPANYIKTYASPVIARYWQIEIDDTTNSDGYIDISRVVIAPVWRASVNFLPGQSSIGWTSASTVKYGRTGVRFPSRKPSRRYARFGFDLLPESEVFAQPFEMARQDDLDGEVLVIPDSDNVTTGLQQSFLANLRVLPEFDYGQITYMSTVIEAEEVL